MTLKKKSQSAILGVIIVIVIIVFIVFFIMSRGSSSTSQQDSELIELKSSNFLSVMFDNSLYFSGCSNGTTMPLLVSDCENSNHMPEKCANLKFETYCNYAKQMLSEELNSSFKDSGYNYQFNITDYNNKNILGLNYSTCKTNYISKSITIIDSSYRSYNVELDICRQVK